METACPECGYNLWAEDRDLGAHSILVYFDDEEQSETYAEHVKLCPECATGLNTPVILRKREAT